MSINNIVLEQLNGSIETITFHNAENGFCVLRVKAKGPQPKDQYNKDSHNLITVIGNAATVHAGEYVECEGTWFNDKKYGLQFKATSIRVIPPTTLAGIEKYLSSGMIKGIGPHFAKKLIKIFGVEVLTIIEEQPQRMLEIEGIGEKRLNLITESWQAQQTIRQIMIFLQTHGVGTARAVRIYKTYGDQAINVVRENPYRLATDIRGIGFKTADALAIQLGIPTDSPLRAQAGVYHVLQELCLQGHCAIPYEKLLETSTSLLNISNDIIQEAIRQKISSEEMLAEHIDDILCIFPNALYRAEVGATQHLFRLLKQSLLPWGIIDSSIAIPWVEAKTELQLSESQKQAIATALANKVTIITGGPGVGKTTVVNSILRIILAKKTNVALCAPTGRAAKRLNQTTHYPAKTIHRLLEFDTKTFSFRYNADNPLTIDFLIVDEVSMIDISLMHHLLKALPSRAALLLVGDVDQLPSVSPGAVLGDLIRSDIIPTVKLTKIFRQTHTSQIILNAHRINEGESPIPYGLDSKSDFCTILAETPQEILQHLMKTVTHYIPQQLKLNPIHDIQILSPMNRGELGTRALNTALQNTLNSHSKVKITQYGTSFVVGDKVIQNCNNYDKDVFNGDIGFISQINLEDNITYIDFDGRQVEYEFSELDELNLAYAISIHKSQGSEYPVVIIPLSTQHYTLLARNLLYTGVSRGKKLVILIGQKKAIDIAVKNNQANKRLTKLAERVRTSSVEIL